MSDFTIFCEDLWENSSRKKIIQKPFSSDHFVLRRIRLKLSSPLKLSKNDELNLIYDPYSIVIVVAVPSSHNPSHGTKGTKKIQFNVSNPAPININEWLAKKSLELFLHSVDKYLVTIDIALHTDKAFLPNARTLIGCCYDIPNQLEFTRKHKVKNDGDEFLLTIQKFVKGKCNRKKVTHPWLLPTLRPYQEDAVSWMLMRESNESTSINLELFKPIIYELTSLNGKAMFFNKYSDILSLFPLDEIVIPSGGILADEMGLGKTVEVIACILNNPRNIEGEDNSDYLLPKMTNQDSLGDRINSIDEGNSSVSAEANEIRVSDNYNNKEDVQCAKRKKKVNNCDSSSSKKPKKRKPAENEQVIDIRDEISIYEKRPRKSIKVVLGNWYETILSEYSTVGKGKSVKKESEYDFKCICGEENIVLDKQWKENGFCFCGLCKSYQHCNCVGFKVEQEIYYCPNCWFQQKLVKSGATLVITPTSISRQWIDELKKHVKQNTIKILFYEGVKEYIQPTHLATYDVVVTTYKTLSTDLLFAVPANETRLRNKKRFQARSSPITRVHWWRLCLDEAQMVESDSSIPNKMVKLIEASHRWSVTGTPIQKSLYDIFYLLEYLKIIPFAEKEVWENCLYLPYINGCKEPLLTLMSKVFWRNNKTSVEQDLMLPEQTVKYHRLKFNAIEKFSYDSVRNQTVANFDIAVAKLKLYKSTVLNTLGKQTLEQVLRPLLTLRQVCTHFNVAKGFITNTTKIGNFKNDCSDYLIKKAKVQTEENARQYVSALNGLAGLSCIDCAWVGAIEYYRSVLQFCEEYKNVIHVDSLQRIHTLTNLDEALRFSDGMAPPTLRDDSLKTEAEALENNYMQKILDEMKTSQRTLETITEKITALELQLDRKETVWWLQILYAMGEQGFDDLVNKFIEVFGTTNRAQNYGAKLNNIPVIEFTLRAWLKSLDESRIEVITYLSMLEVIPKDMMVERAVECHLRRTNRKGPKCELCNCEKMLLDYECQLFNVQRKNFKALVHEKELDGAETKGSWSPHNAEVVLKTILSFARSAGDTASSVQWGNTHLQLLTHLKKEFKQLRVVWMSLNHIVQSQDEISMSKLRLRLRLPDEEPLPKARDTKQETIFVLEPHQVEAQKLVLTSDCTRYLSAFKKKHGTLLYLKNVCSENSAPDPCPICHTPIEQQWFVFVCGHSYCSDCIKPLCENSHSSGINCPVCRELTHISELSFVDLSQDSEETVYDDIDVIGSYTTKIATIVKVVLQTIKDDTSAKILLFSTWTRVLDILAQAFTENSVSFRRLPGGKLVERLQQFKDPKLNVKVLMLPIGWGSKGLNITEASNLIFVEPILSVADEMQAIGRIHRIGQKKQTVIHRFIIKDSIEERIEAAVRSASEKWQKNKFTIEDLSNLFATDG